MARAARGRQTRHRFGATTRASVATNRAATPAGRPDRSSSVSACGPVAGGVSTMSRWRPSPSRRDVIPPFPGRACRRRRPPQRIKIGDLGWASGRPVSMRKPSNRLWAPFRWIGVNPDRFGGLNERTMSASSGVAFPLAFPPSRRAATRDTSRTHHNPVLPPRRFGGPRCGQPARNRRVSQIDLGYPYRPDGHATSPPSPPASVFLTAAGSIKLGFHIGRGEVHITGGGVDVGVARVPASPPIDTRFGERWPQVARARWPGPGDAAGYRKICRNPPSSG